MMREGFGVARRHCLSEMQMGMAYHSLLSPDRPTYVVTSIYLIEGPLDIDAFVSSWSLLIRHHDALRMAIAVDSRDGFELVAKSSVDLPLRVVDISKEPSSSVESLKRRLVEDERSSGISIDRAPLMKLLLIRMSPQVHLLVWTHHHLILDGWSKALLLREFARCYVSGSSLDDSAPKFGQYLDWLAERRSGSESIWVSEYSDVEPTLVGDRDKPRSTLGAGSVTIELPSYDVSDLYQTVRLARLTPSSVLHFAYATAIHWAIGKSEVTFGSVMADRPWEVENAEEIVGLLIKTIPIRLAPLRGDSLVTAIRRFQADHARLRDSHYPGLQRISELAGCSASAMFDSLLAVENYPSDGYRNLLLGQETTMTLQKSIEDSDYPLSVQFFLRGQALETTLLVDRGYVASPRFNDIQAGLIPALDYIGKRLKVEIDLDDSAG